MSTKSLHLYRRRPFCRGSKRTRCSGAPPAAANPAGNAGNAIGRADVETACCRVADDTRIARALDILGRRMRATDALTSPGAVRDYLRLSLAGREHEVFVVVLLDAQYRVLRCEELFRGTLTQTSVYPREVVKTVLAVNAGSVIFAHNHPSGVSEPSRADELLTRNLKSALALVDVNVLDHFVVAGADWISFAERGLL